jgi:hypothetical protein
MGPRRFLASIVAVALVGGVAPTLAAAAWTAPVTISAPGQDAPDPQVAVDRFGNAVFTWQQFNGNRHRIQARALSAAGVLSPIQTLSGSGQDAFVPQVAVDPQGDAVFTWRRFDGTNWRIQARARSAAGALGPVQTLSAAGQDAFGPEVGIDGAGNAVFTWQRFDGSHRRIQARVRSAAGVLGPIQTLSAAGHGAQHPQIAVNRGGQAVVTWDGFVPTTPGCCRRVQARTRSAAGALGPLQVVSPSPNRSQDVTSPQVGVDATGNAVFTWEFIQRGFRDESEIVARALSAAGVLGPVKFLSPPHGSGGGGFQPQVAVDGAGDALFAWTFVNDYVAPEWVQARARSAAGAFSPVRTLSPRQGEINALGPQVGIDGAGNGVFTWIQDAPTGTDLSIKARTRSATGAVGPLETLSTFKQAFFIGPQIAVDRAGDAVVTWPFFDGTNYIVQAAAGP